MFWNFISSYWKISAMENNFCKMTDLLVISKLQKQPLIGVFMRAVFWDFVSNYSKTYTTENNFYEMLNRHITKIVFHRKCFITNLIWKFRTLLWKEYLWWLFLKFYSYNCLVKVFEKFSSLFLQNRTRGLY